MSDYRPGTHRGLPAWIDFTTAHDCIHVQPCVFGSDRCKPDSGGSHGRGTVRATWYLGAAPIVVQFQVFTGWHHPATPSAVQRRGGDIATAAADWGYHSTVPMYDGHTLVSEHCLILGPEPGVPCYYDGGSLAAEEPWEAFRVEGPDALWERMHEHRRQLLNDLGGQA